MATVLRSLTALVLLAPLANADEIDAEGNKLGKSFRSAVESVRKVCRQTEAETVLLIVGEDAKSREEDAGPTLDLVADELTAALVSRRVEVVNADTVGDDDEGENEAAKRTRIRRVITPRDASRWAERAEFDLVLEAAYRNVRGDRSLRLAIVDTQERRLLLRIDLDEKTLAEAVASRDPKARSAIARATGRATTGRATTGGSSRSRTASSGTAARGKLGERPNGATGTAGVGSVGNVPNGALPENLPPGNPVGLNKRVLEFATANFGKQVGNGECWTLANEALIAAGAQPARGYTFGRQIPRNTVGPGDILQFKSVRIDRGNYYWYFGTPNHTAVVEAAKGDVVTILHQNFGTKTVTRFTIDFADMTAGSVWGYRPVVR